MLTEDDVYAHVHGICFKTGPPGKVGVESEWFVTDTERPTQRVDLDRLAAIVSEAGPPPAGSTVSFEPGGQLELSSPAFQGPAQTYQALATDLDHITRPLAAHGLRLHGSGFDEVHHPHRQLNHPRYAAMERFFDARGPDGRAMMCNTAALQVNLDIGTDAADAARRWRLVHRLGPVLLAAFANSPARRGPLAGWRSARWGTWRRIDATRTRPVGPGDPAAAWARYALGARLMTIRQRSGPWLTDPGMAFAEWLCHRRPRAPEHDDLDFHLSTLFPPVRPRGWLELRMIDAQSPRWWPVAMAVPTALLDDPVAAGHAEDAVARLEEAAEPGVDLWAVAARDALSSTTELARCARECVEAAVAALPRLGADTLADLAAEFHDRFSSRGRCPADEVLTAEGAA